jgi:hypothetical protein
MKKYIIFSLVLILVGITIGALVVYGYYDSKEIQSPEGEISEADDSSCEIEDLNLSQEEKDLRAAAAYLKFKEIKRSFIPSGIPEVYGQELDISFDQVQDAIDKVKIFGPTFGQEGKKIVLSGNDLNRYIDIGFRIACEYCCGVKTLVKEDGEAACGCAHSIMMRGLAAYLIKNHPEFSNDKILEELEKWKITYFPKQTLSEKLYQLGESGEAGIEEILQEFPDFLPQMVGGC